MVLLAVADLVMEALQKSLTFKGGKATDPDICLGAKIRKRSYEDGELWTVSSSHCVDAANIFSGANFFRRDFCRSDSCTALVGVNFRPK